MLALVLALVLVLVLVVSKHGLRIVRRASAVDVPDKRRPAVSDLL